MYQNQPDELHLFTSTDNKVDDIDYNDINDPKEIEKENKDEDYNDEDAEINDQQTYEVPVTYYINLRNSSISQSFICNEFHQISVVSEIERNVSENYMEVPIAFSPVLQYLLQMLNMSMSSTSKKKIFILLVLRSIYEIVIKDNSLYTLVNPGRKLILVVKKWRTNTTQIMINSYFLSNYDEKHLLNYIQAMSEMEWEFPGVTECLHMFAYNFE